MNRVILTGILVLSYLVSFNIYIYLLANGFLGNVERRLFYYYMTAAMTILSWIDLKAKTNNPYHEQFNNIAWLSLFANFVLNILNYHSLLLADAPHMFLTFNGLVFALTFIVLINGVRHGYFKNRYENE